MTLKDITAGPVKMIGSAAERLPGLPHRKKERPSKMKVARRVLERAGTVLGIAVTGWEIYETLRSAGVGDSKGGTATKTNANAKAKPRSTSGKKRSGGSSSRSNAKRSSAKRSNATSSSGTARKRTGGSRKAA